MKLKNPLPKLSLLQDEIPEHVQEYMHLTKLAEIGRLSGVVAHEINNPLMVIHGMTENIEFMLDAGTLDIAAIRWNSDVKVGNLTYARDVAKVNARSERAAAPLSFIAPVIGGVARFGGQFG